MAINSASAKSWLGVFWLVALSLMAVFVIFIVVNWVTGGAISRVASKTMFNINITKGAMTGDQTAQYYRYTQSRNSEARILGMASDMEVQSYLLAKEIGSEQTGITQYAVRYLSDRTDVYNRDRKYICTLPIGTRVYADFFDEISYKQTGLAENLVRIKWQSNTQSRKSTIQPDPEGYVLRSMVGRRVSSLVSYGIWTDATPREKGDIQWQEVCTLLPGTTSKPLSVTFKGRIYYDVIPDNGVRCTIWVDGVSRDVIGGAKKNSLPHIDSGDIVRVQLPANASGQQNVLFRVRNRT